MYKLLVVDDEQYLVESMVKTIAWREMGIDQVFMALSGKEALKILETNTIDIVITDIRMPEISGLELIGIINNRWKNVKCILLSGYSEFEYAKQAIQLKTADYLLKPVINEELIDAVEHVVQAIKQETDHLNVYNSALTNFKENQALIKSNLLNSLLQGEKFLPSSLSEKLSMLDLPFEYGDSFIVTTIRLDEVLPSSKFENHTLLQFAIDNIAKEILCRDFYVWGCVDVHDYFVFLIKFKGSSFDTTLEHNIDLDRRIRDLGGKLQSSIQIFLKCKISLVFSKAGKFPEDFRVFYQAAIASLGRHADNDHEYLLFSADYSSSRQIQTIQSLYEPPALFYLFESGNWDNIIKKLNGVFQEMREQKLLSKEYLLEVFHVICNAFIHFAHKNGFHLEEIIGDDFQKVAMSPSFYSIKQLEDWTYRVISKLKDDIENDIKSDRNSIILQVQNYIEENLKEDLSLQAISDHVYLHPVYLSKIYKVEMGEGLSEYIYRLRMEKAAHLLKNSRKKIRDISFQIGYENTSYFIKMFKKYYGQTPKEYRDSVVAVVHRRAD
jgi:two-component system response regulator YesN